MLEGPEREVAVRFAIPRTAAVAAALVSLAAPRVFAADGEPADVRGLPDGPVLEAYPNPSLGQTILFARFPDDRTGTASVTIHDAHGSPRANISAALEAGAAMFVWDGRGDDGVAMPAGVYVAKLVLEEESLEATFEVR
jgi:hypothetical protein